MTRHRVVVDRESAGRRLDAFAAAALTLSRSQLRLLIDAQRVTVGGVPRKASYVVRSGDRVEVDVPPPAPERAAPEELPLAVVYEDEVLIAINKAPGVVVHPAPGRWHGTLVNALLHRWGTLPGRDAARPGIVHRLDRDTSGLIVVARTPIALERLARQFHDRTVEKRYLALVDGVVRREAFVVDAPIGRHPVDRKRMSTRARVGRPAVTRVRVLERFAGLTFVEAAPETGRTHQIRVHLAAAGHPVLGDKVYGPARVPPLRASHQARGKREAMHTVSIVRQALHAAELEITHPETGQRLTLEAPLWPDLAAVVAELRAEAGRDA